MATVLSGTSGALYYKPAGTSATFKAADVTSGSDQIKLGTFLNFKVNDKVSFTTGEELLFLLKPMWQLLG